MNNLKKIARTEWEWLLSHRYPKFSLLLKRIYRTMVPIINISRVLYAMHVQEKRSGARADCFSYIICLMLNVHQVVHFWKYFKPFYNRILWYHEGHDRRATINERVNISMCQILCIGQIVKRRVSNDHTFQLPRSYDMKL